MPNVHHTALCASADALATAPAARWTRPAAGRLVVSIDLLQRSVALEIDCCAVVGA